MDRPNYKYDVAFSFLAQDEALATAINDSIQDRLRTFLYSKKQEEVAGTDGEKTFNAVFGQDSRLVVVLYRTGWGQTPWTRIEETAIRNRAYNDGYDFVKFIPLDEPPSVPKWLPKSQIWLGLKRWGFPGVASVIEARVAELGGEAKEESVVERAARLDRFLKFSEKRKQFLSSHEGVTAAEREFDSLRPEFEHQINALRANSISLELKSARRQLVILGLLQGMSINWRCYWSNSLDKASLDVTLWDCHPPFPTITHFEKPKQLDSMEFTFELLPSDQYRWVSSDASKRAFTTKDLVSFLLKYYLDKVQSRNRKP